MIEEKEKIILCQCNPSVCIDGGKHDYANGKEEPIPVDGKIMGWTKVCSKCGMRAIDESMWK